MMADTALLPEPTLFAPASGFGRAAVAVIRVSGPAARHILEALCPPLPAPRRLSLRAIRDPATGEVLDRGLAVWMPAPATFTGQDMAELHLHGGLAVRSAVLRALAALPGCRPAGPGDFSRRAFLNGRLDLPQAEGIADLVAAETEAQRRQALRQLDGALGRQVAAWRAQAIGLLAEAEAALDFSDEGDVDEDALDAGLAEAARALRDAIRTALGDGRRGERLREGFFVVLAGPPNAGKSTLLNALAGREAAIVSETPGTTRDAIEVRCDLGGLPVVFVDTAGLRETEDAVEAEGVRRTRSRMAEADLVLRLSPCHAPNPPPAAEAGRGLLVRTKADLISDGDDSPSSPSARATARRQPSAERADPDHGSGSAPPGIVGSAPSRDEAGAIAISALTGQGLDALLGAIQAAAQSALGGEQALITRERHREALARACAHLDRVVQGRALPPELVAEDLRLATRALGEVGGHVGVETILDRLFAGFCIGK